MQSAKGEGLAGAFGGGGTGLTGAVFGGRGAASFLSKATTVLAVIFMINCGVLAYMSSHRSASSAGATSSVVTEQAQREMERQAEQQQALPMDSTGVMQTQDTGGIESILPPGNDNEGQ
jgi:preprotein translocase subunit SecG